MTARECQQDTQLSRTALYGIIGCIMACIMIHCRHLLLDLIWDDPGPDSGCISVAISSFAILISSLFVIIGAVIVTAAHAHACSTMSPCWIHSHQGHRPVCQQGREPGPTNPSGLCAPKYIYRDWYQYSMHM